MNCATATADAVHGRTGVDLLPPEWRDVSPDVISALTHDMIWTVARVLNSDPRVEQIEPLLAKDGDILFWRARGLQGLGVMTTKGPQTISHHAEGWGRIPNGLRSVLLAWRVKQN